MSEFIIRCPGFPISKTEPTKLDNTTYNILSALGKEADFFDSKIDTYIRNAKIANRSDLVNMWKKIKKDRQSHLHMLRQALEKGGHKDDERSDYTDLIQGEVNDEYF
jgi:rubrerythrin